MVDKITAAKKLNTFLKWMLILNTLITLCSFGWYVASIIWRNISPTTKTICALVAIVLTIIHALLMYLAWYKVWKMRKNTPEYVARRIRLIYVFLFLSIFCYVGLITINIVNIFAKQWWLNIPLALLSIINFFILVIVKRSNKVIKRTIKIEMED